MLNSLQAVIMIKIRSELTFHHFDINLKRELSLYMKV